MLPVFEADFFIFLERLLQKMIDIANDSPVRHDLQLRRALRKGTQKAYRAIREVVPATETDRVVYQDINKEVELLKNERWVTAVLMS